jgi:hypothetical protein
MKNTCKTCNHFRPTLDGQGTCHRYAPKPCQIMVGPIVDFPENITSWPTVASTDVCGDYLCRLEPVEISYLPSADRVMADLCVGQALAPVLDESILQSFRDMDDPDAEIGQHDIDAWNEYGDAIRDLADRLVPEQPEPKDDQWVTECPVHAQWRQRMTIRQRLLDEAKRARERQ